MNLLLGSLAMLWLLTVVTPLKSMRWYRKLRGGRWSQVTGFVWGKRWIKVPDECVEPVDEDWRPRIDPTRVQAAPLPGDTPVWDLVIEDMRKRDHLGRAKYGTPLQTNNGRDFLLDAYQEALDLTVYLRGAIEERDKLGGLRDTLRGAIALRNKQIKDFT